MPVTWLAPAVLAALTLVAIPVAIHLLVRERSRPRPFPSIRFLRESRLSSVTRRSIHDWLLLAARVATVAIAVAALAAPVWTGAGRGRAWASRLARAVVAVPADDAAARDELRTAAFGSVFVRNRLADGVAAAVRWLEAQPPARRELVIVAPFVRGSLDEAALAQVPAHVGIRFVRTPAGPATPEVNVLRRVQGGQVVVPLALTLDDRTTVVRSGPPSSAGGGPVEVEAGGGQGAEAAATLAAVLSAGVRLPRDESRRVLVSWNGPSAPAGVDVHTRWMQDAVARLPGVRASQDGNRLVLGLADAPGSLAAARHLATVLETVFDEPMTPLEPVAIDDAQLDAWTREPGDVPADAPLSDEGDRRWLWALALVLLGVEQWLRRGTPGEAGAVAPEAGSEVDRVA
ncbi:MAG: BatA domain-containing protein [Vicinamibacterales bacterium]